MRQEKLAPEPVLRAYMAVLHDAILNARMRIRYGETIDPEELHDLLDGIHNIPEMLCAYGGWHVEANIDQHLRDYDERWYVPGSASRRCSLVQSLEREKERLRGRGEPTPPRPSP